MRCTLGAVPITQGIRANKTWGSGAERPGGNPYGPDRELFLCFLLFGGIAQLVEHNICNVGVAGSNPTTST